jgi:hypothetical protein
MDIDQTKLAVSELMTKACKQYGLEPEYMTISRPKNVRKGASRVARAGQDRSPSENQIQADFFKWLSLHEKAYPELGLFYAIPNGSHKSPAARGLFRRTGLKPGVPDVHLPVHAPDHEIWRDGKCGLWIEFKSKRGTVSDAQKQWFEKLKSYRHRVEICRSWIEAANITIEYLGLPLKKL